MDDTTTIDIPAGTAVDDPQSDTMQNALAQLRAALGAVKRATGIRCERWTVAVAAHGAPAELGAAWVDCGGEALPHGAVRCAVRALPTEGDADTITITAHVSREDRARFHDLTAARSAA